MDKKSHYDATLNRLAMTGAQMGRAASATVSHTTLQVAQLLMVMSGTKGQPESQTHLLYDIAETLRSNMVVQLMAPLAAYIMAEHKERGETCGEECAAHMLQTVFSEMIPSILENATSLANAADKVVKRRVAEDMMSDEDRLTDKEREAVVKDAMDALASLMASGGKPN